MAPLSAWSVNSVLVLLVFHLLIQMITAFFWELRSGDLAGQSRCFIQQVNPISHTHSLLCTLWWDKFSVWRICVKWSQIPFSPDRYSYWWAYIKLLPELLELEAQNCLTDSYIIAWRFPFTTGSCSNPGKYRYTPKSSGKPSLKLGGDYNLTGSQNLEW